MGVNILPDEQYELAANVSCDKCEPCDLLSCSGVNRLKSESLVLHISHTFSFTSFILEKLLWLDNWQTLQLSSWLSYSRSPAAHHKFRSHYHKTTKGPFVVPWHTMERLKISEHSQCGGSERHSKVENSAEYVHCFDCRLCLQYFLFDLSINF